MKRFALLRLLALACSLLLGGVAAHAQSTPPKETLSDAERARRDAEKVFGFLKFSTVKPAAPPVAKAAAPAPVRSAAPAPSAASKTPVAAAASPAVEPAPAPVQAAASVALPDPQPSAAAVPAEPPPAAAAVQAEPEPEEAPLKLIAYTAPELHNKLLDLIGDRRINVPVRFKVEADGQVSAAQALGNVPRGLGQAAVRAVQRWRFAPLPAAREVDVEIAFQVGN